MYPTIVDVRSQTTVGRAVNVKAASAYHNVLSKRQVNNRLIDNYSENSDTEVEDYEEEEVEM